MRIWLIGADQKAIEIIRQLRKNRNIEIIVSDALEKPKAVTEGLIAKVDHVEQVTSININMLARRVRPDLILIDAGANQLGNTRMTGVRAFTDALNDEIVAASDYPCLVL